MTDLLPIGIDELLGGAVESTRLEFKATWDDKVTGPQVLRTICAFANDLYNLNGGYIVIGVAEADGIAQRPVAGIARSLLDGAQKWIRGRCNTIDPPYQPLMAPAEVDGQAVLVVHAPASQTRPHHAPSGEDGKGDRVAWVRVGSETVKANKEPLRTQLYQQTARVPFDDRRAVDATVDDLRESKVREFLRDVQSDLVHERDTSTLYRALRLLHPVNGHHVPRNIALLFFSDDPRRWFPGAYVDVVRFGADDGTTLEERRFNGSLPEQIRGVLSYLNGFAVRHLRKTPHEVEAQGFVSYPSLALREALVNAIYHRSYDPSVPDPTKVYLHADRVEIISYPGPGPGLERADFEGERVRPMPARNRRIGELLKELRLAEERSTGVPKIYRSMRENGSPRPEFDFDTARSYFRVTLPAHPEYVVVEALTEAVYLETTGDARAAARRLREALSRRPGSVVVAVALLKLLGRMQALEDAREVAEAFEGDAASSARVGLALAELVIENGTMGAREARRLIENIPAEALAAQDAMDAAIVARRAGRPKEAHSYFIRAGSLVEADVKMLHEFAQTKVDLARAFRRRGRWTQAEREARSRLLREAQRMLERVLGMDAPRERHAWAWYNLGWVRRQLGLPESEQREAYANAARLLPDVHRFTEALARYDTD